MIKDSKILRKQWISAWKKGGKHSKIENPQPKSEVKVQSDFLIDQSDMLVNIRE